MSKKKDSFKPWLSRPAINRSVTIPFTTSLTHRLSSLGEFHPNELDPFLLFDARDSMIGTLENPTLDLDPSKPDTLNVITATRAGVATFTDANGLIASASPNTVRVDHVDGVPMILVEPSSENLLTYSEDFSENYWGKQNVTVSAAPVAAPDGSMTATHVVKGTSEGHLVRSQIVTNGSDTIGIWARTVSGSGTVFFNYHSGTPSTVTDEWQRFEVTANAAHVYAVNFRGSSTLDELYIWGVQAETGSVATSYIPTSGGDAAARTRAADDLEISGSSFSDFYNASEGTTYMEVVPEQSASKSVLFEYMDESAGANDIMGSYLTSGVSYFYGITSGSFVANASLGTTNLSELNRIAVNYKVNDMFGSINGATSFRYTSLALPTGIDKLAIGNDNSGNFSITGRIRRLIYWPYHSDSL